MRPAGLTWLLMISDILFRHFEKKFRVVSSEFGEPRFIASWYSPYLKIGQASCLTIIDVNIPYPNGCIYCLVEVEGPIVLRRQGSPAISGKTENQ